MNGLKMHHLHPFFKQNKTGEDTPSPIRKEKILPHNVYRRSELWRQKLHTILGGKSTGNRQKWVKKAPFAFVFQKFSRRDPTPPLLREDKKPPLFVRLLPLQLRWKISRLAYIGDRSFESKINTRFFGGKINTNSTKIGSECTIYIRFSKTFSGRPRPPTARG